MKQLDLFDKEEEEEPLTLIQAIKNDPFQLIFVSTAMIIFLAGAFLT